MRKASILGVNSWEDALGVLKPALHTAASSLPRALAAIISNLARASRTLVLRALFGASKSCAFVNLYMDLPPDGRRAASRQRPNSVSDHRYLIACLTK